MTLSELKQTVIDQAGQQLNTAIDTEVSDTIFQRIVEKIVLPKFGRYKYKSEIQRFYTVQSPYVFVDPAPDWISYIKPLNFLSLSNPLAALLKDKEIDSITGISKPSFLYKYEKPNLYIEYVGEMEARVCYRAYVDESSLNEIQYVKDSDLDTLIELTLGHFLVSLGRSRRLAKLTELPIEIDAEALVNEGNDLIRATEEKLHLNSDWHLAVG